MTIKTSGSLSLQEIADEFGGNTPHSLTEYYAGGAFVPSGISGINGAIPSSGLINFNVFYGATRIIPKGYFAGKQAFTSTNTIEALLFSNETSNFISAQLSLPREAAAGVNSSSSGYFAGGYDSGGSTPYNEIDGIIFSSETAINPAATLAVNTHNLVPTNSVVRGYFAAGSVSPVNTIFGFIFSSESSYVLTAVLPTPSRIYSTGASSSTKGYVAGGRFGSGFSNKYNTISSILFSAETAANLTATLAQARSQLAGVNSEIKGYFGGGILNGGNGTTYTNEIDGVIFSSDSAFNPAAALSRARPSLMGVNSTSAGYFAGGFGNTPAADSIEIDGIIFSSETAINPAATLAEARNSQGTCNSGSL